MKTPIQELIEEYQRLREDGDNDMRTVIYLAEEMLEKEKEFIQEVYWEGGQEVPQHWSTVDDWYNKTFNAKEK